MTRSKARTAAFGVLPLVLALSPTIARAQTDVAIQIGWTQGSKPSEVEFNTGNVQTRPFKDEGTHFFGRREKPTLNTPHDFVVRWTDFSVTLRVRARTGGISSGPEFFRIRKPNTAMLCNDNQVRALVIQSAQASTDNYLSSMLQAMALLRRETSKCNAANAAVLAGLMLKLNQKLGAEEMSLVFDLSPDVEALYRRVHQGSPFAQTQLAAARQGIRNLLVSSALSELARLQGPGNEAALDSFLSQMIAATSDSEFKAALGAIDLTEIQLQRLRPQSLVRWDAALKAIDGKPADAVAVIEREDTANVAADAVRDPAEKATFGEGPVNVIGGKNPEDALPDMGAFDRETIEPAATMIRPDNPLSDAVVAPSPDRVPDADVARDVSTLEDVVAGAEGPG